MSERTRVLLWRLAILIVLVGAWEWLTGVRAISRTPGLYWIDPFFISRPSLILKRFAYLASGQVRLSIWQMALSTVQSTLWGFVVGVSTGFAAGLILGRNDRLARIFEPYIVAFNSLPRIALVPLISPYRAGREQARALHDAAGLTFLEVFVDAPLDVCEARDPKGLYAKARAGELKGFTGIDDPYEAPVKPELVLKPATMSVEESVQACLDLLKSRGLLSN